VQGAATMVTTKSKRELKQDYDGMEGAVTDIGLDSYATAWRYLGLYTDCSDGSSSSWWSGWSSNNNNSSSAECSGGTRKLLWAAYKNPDYTGMQIGEYEFYVDEEWDNSTCVDDTCTRMDCHDPWNSSWELLGIYKETVNFGNDMFFEQLFKHQGYCLWDGDKENSDDDGSSSGDSNDYSGWASSNYQFMQAMRNELPSGCTSVGDFTYGSESNYYINIKPLSEGNMTLGVYSDSSCLVESEFSFEDYQQSYASSLTSTASSGAFDTWNDNMDSYKVCQPCRAYNREQIYQSNWDQHRSLTEYYDGQGGYELNNYNCYDDAHYQNCNQCYKFETHTDMEQASQYDLEAASAEGTILLINYKGTWYGNGTVGDAAEPTDTNSTTDTTGDSVEADSYGSSGYDSTSDAVSYSFAGGAAFMICGFALVKAFHKFRKPRIVLASEEGSTAPSPLV